MRSSSVRLVIEVLVLLRFYLYLAILFAVKAALLLPPALEENVASHVSVPVVYEGSWSQRHWRLVIQR